MPVYGMSRSGAARCLFDHETRPAVVLFDRTGLQQGGFGLVEPDCFPDEIARRVGALENAARGVQPDIGERVNELVDHYACENESQRLLAVSRYGNQELRDLLARYFAEG